MKKQPSQEAGNIEQKFWIQVNRAEAYFGLAMFDAYRNAVAEAKALPHEKWMMESFEQQVNKLTTLFEKTGHLLNPKWQYK